MAILTTKSRKLMFFGLIGFSLLVVIVTGTLLYALLIAQQTPATVNIPPVSGTPTPSGLVTPTGSATPTVTGSATPTVTPTLAALTGVYHSNDFSAGGLAYGFNYPADFTQTEISAESRFGATVALRFTKNNGVNDEPVTDIEYYVDAVLPKDSSVLIKQGQVTTPHASNPDIPLTYELRSITDGSVTKYYILVKNNIFRLWLAGNTPEAIARAEAILSTYSDTPD